MTDTPSTRDFPYQDGDVTVLGPEIFASDDGRVICWKGENYVPQQRLRLAHQARRAKEHHLDDVRRALCDIGFMDDDDPYSHADLADVIRQNGQAAPLNHAGDVVREQPTPHLNIRLYVGPDEIGAEVGRMLRKVRRQSPGGGA